MAFALCNILKEIPIFFGTDYCTSIIMVLFNHPLLNTIKALQLASNYISLLAMATCYFGSLMTPSAQRIGLAVMGVNPLTSTGTERLLLALADLSLSLYGLSANSDLTRG